MRGDTLCRHLGREKTTCSADCCGGTLGDKNKVLVVCKEVAINQRILLVHIGHPKTGTSYIQALLAKNKPQMQQYGICFPDTDFTLKVRESDPGTGGNCRLHLLEDSEYHKLVTSGSDSVVLSAERLFFPLSEGRDLFESYSPSFDMVRLLLFIRDPLDFVTSWYTQRVKRGDFVGSFDEFVIANDYFTSHLDRVESIIDLCARVGHDLCVRNYSKLTASLDNTMEDVLNVPRGTLERPALQKVNRGLTKAERYLQQRLHHHLGPCFDLDLGGHQETSKSMSYQIVTKALCTALPDLKTEYAELSPTVHKEFCHRNNAGIVRVNQRLPESERYDALLEQVDPSSLATPPTESLLFSEAQIDALAQSIAGVLMKCRRRDGGGFWQRLKRRFW